MLLLCVLIEMRWKWRFHVNGVDLHHVNSNKKRLNRYHYALHSHGKQMSVRMNMFGARECVCVCREVVYCLVDVVYPMELGQ